MSNNPKQTRRSKVTSAQRKMELESAMAGENLKTLHAKQIKRGYQLTPASSYAISMRVAQRLNEGTAARTFDEMVETGWGWGFGDC